MKKHKNTLSFFVTKIIQRKDEMTGIIFNETVLSSINSGEVLTIRGKPWPVGAKIDFSQISCELNGKKYES